MAGVIRASNWPTAEHDRRFIIPPERDIGLQHGCKGTVSQLTSQGEGNLSVKDIYHIAFLLRQVLIPDLVPQILAHAGIYSTATFTRKQDITVSRDRSPQTVLITPPIWSRVRREHPVVKVVFGMRARDEGLALQIGKSYFTAAVCSEDVLRHCGPDDRAETLRKVIEESERHVCTNTIASDMYETHVVEWAQDAEDLGEAAWVTGLRAGDRIMVHAYAQWASFENCIAEVEVQVHSLVIVR